MDILHIYGGTSGSSGTYMNEIHKALNKNFNQEVIVSYFYPFNYGKKIFYKFSDLSKPNFLHKINKIRLAIRYIEMMFALCYSFIYIKTKKPKVINYSLTTQVNLELIFLKLIKKYTKSKLLITAHDVVPFETNYSNYEQSVLKRKRFFDLADKLIVHNQKSIDDLKKYYDYNENKIIKYSFPIMDITDIQYNEEDKIKNLIPTNKKIFSFVGHLRKEKGIEVLLQAWEDFTKNYEISKECFLVIAGSIPKGFNYNFSDLDNFILVDRFLNDVEYKSLIKTSECVILPYTKGTNSGIPSTVLTLGTKIITSDIDMFKDNEVIDKKYMFNSGDSNDLVSIINKLASSNDYSFEFIKSYEGNFIVDINNIFMREIKDIIDA